MRLDHLLSKEHWPPDWFWWSRAAPGSRWPVSLDGLHASGVVLEGGTLTSSAGIVCCALVRPLGVWNACGDADRFVGTLLGPEGADPAGECSPVVDVALVSGPACISYRCAACGW